MHLPPGSAEPWRKEAEQINKSSETCGVKRFSLPVAAAPTAPLSRFRDALPGPGAGWRPLGISPRRTGPGRGGGTGQPHQRVPPRCAASTAITASGDGVLRCLPARALPTRGGVPQRRGARRGATCLPHLRARARLL